MTGLTIGKLAKETGVGTETIRYYERSGFLPPADRLPSGYRVYDSETVKRLKFIKEAQQLGFTLTEINDLLALTDDPSADCAEVNSRAEVKLSEIEKKISQLEKMRTSLRRIASYCPADEAPLSECSIIRHLYGKSETGNE